MPLSGVIVTFVSQFSLSSVDKDASERLGIESRSTGDMLCHEHCDESSAVLSLGSDNHLLYGE